MEQSQKKRVSNFSNDEKRILTELVLKYQHLVENKRTDATTNSAKLKGWMQLAEEFNAVSTNCHRNHAALKCCWENIKRQAKKDRADRKKKIFMTGGGNPPSPPPSSGQAAIVDAVLGPALEGIDNIYDSDAGAIIQEIIELDSTVENTFCSLNTNYDVENEENINAVSNTDTKEVIPKKILCTNNTPQASFSKCVLTENNEGVDWSSWTPKNLKTPVSSQLKVPTKSEEDWLKRRRPKTDSLGDTLVKEKITLVKILQDNAAKECNIRLAILEEQLKQEKIKTKKLNNAD